MEYWGSSSRNCPTIIDAINAEENSKYMYGHVGAPKRGAGIFQQLHAQFLLNVFIFGFGHLHKYVNTCNFAAHIVGYRRCIHQ